MAKSKSKPNPNPNPNPKSSPPPSSPPPPSTTTPSEGPTKSIPSPKPAPSSPAAPPQTSSPADFDSHYLQRVTAEFADDIDTVRHAGDFKPESIPVLVRALQLGAKGFTEEERRKVMEGV